MPPRSWAALGVAAVLAVAAHVAWLQVFSTHTDYDDEGYVMLSLTSFMSGKPLYDETYTQYGPAYYVAEAGFFGTTGLPVTHDVTRSKTVVVWLAASLACAVLARRAAGPWAASVAAVVAFFHLERLCLEPGHPQELCLLAILIVPLLLQRLEEGFSWRIGAVLGGLVGATVMTKVNVGALLAVSAGLGLVVLGPRDAAGRRLLVAAVAAALALPFLLTAQHLRAPSGLVLPGIVSLSTAAVLVVTLRRNPEPPTLRWRDVFTFGGAAVGGALVFALAALATGTSASGLAYGLIGQHRRLIGDFASPAPIPAAGLAWALVGLVAAAYSGRAPLVADVARWIAVGGLGSTCVRYLVESFVPLRHGLVDRGGAGVLVALATPFLWTLVVPVRDENARRPGPGRIGLSLTACLLPLSAYPMPGTQMALASVLIAVAAVIVLEDGCRRATRRIAGARLIPAALLAGLLVVLGVREVVLRHRSAAMVPLDLPGAARLRMAPETAARYRWLAQALASHADTFVFGEHTRASFYFWTRLRPPTGLNPTFWPFLLRTDEQLRVIEALERAPRAAVVHEPWDGELPGDSPLRAYLARRFRPALRSGDFDVWLRE